MTISFNGKTVLVSGAAQGLGAAMAAAFAASGALVIATDINGPAVAAMGGEIELRGGKCFPFPLDVRDAAACEALAVRVRRELGKISVLVNNAGVSTMTTLEESSLNDEIDAVMAVNLKGVLNLTKACLSDLRQSKGAVVNVASIASLVATFATIPYAASKGALAQTTKYLARELGPQGIRVNAVAPALIITPMTSGLDRGPGSRFENTLSRTMLKRIGTPEDVAGPVLFLASGLAQYITGVVLPVDGGYTAN